MYACNTNSSTEIVSVYATSAAQPWLTELYTCADNSSVILNLAADDPDIFLRVGEPEIIISPVYQIDEEEILIVTHRESPIQNLTLAQAQELFGQGMTQRRSGSMRQMRMCKLCLTNS